MADLTTNFFINQANSFISDVKDTRNAYYVFTGKATAWPDDNNPPESGDSVVQTDSQVYNDLLFGKLLTEQDVSLLIPRYNWVSNTVYDVYDQEDEQLYEKRFFVVNDQMQVYKCIYNNRGMPSTVEPRLTATDGTFSTSDGYIWKYMYTVQGQANTKFTSNSYIPVTPNTAVSRNAIPGTIDAYVITNGGQGYQIYETGFINRLVDRFTIQLPSTSSPNNNFYTRSSIYLKSGFGAGQVREISSYNGATKQIGIATSNPFVIFNNIELISQPQGTVATGYFAEQTYDRIEYLFISNNQAFTVGSNVVQTDTLTTGTILSANSSVIRVMKSNNAATFSLNLPIRDSSQAGSPRTGTVSITSGSNTVTGVGTNFTNTSQGYTVGSYIRVGANTDLQIRRVVQVTNTTSLLVTPAFTNTLISNVHFFVPICATPSSVTINRANGTISNTNLESLKLQISNGALIGQTFILGEQVQQVTSSNTSAGANAIVAFANSSEVYLAGVTGTWTTGLFIRGTSSLQRYQIDNIVSNPNLTLSNPQGEFITGFPVNFKIDPASTGVTGNAILKAVTTIPNDQTEYLIAPTVVITGDGSGALGVAKVNTAFGSAREVTGIDVISVGQQYSFANVTIYANNSFGGNATAKAVISPKSGHGKDAACELGARYVGVSKTFETGEQEGYFFPVYGSFRKIGILANPEFNDLRITLRDFDRVNLVINNKITSSANLSITDWVPGEAVVQPSTGATGVLVTGNSTAVQLRDVRGSFSGGNVGIIGYFSNTTANCFSGIPIRFDVTTDSDTEIVSQLFSGARGEITQVLSNTEVVMSNVVGKFVVGDVLVDTTSNAYATVNSFSTANGSRDVTSTFGLKFNQTARITLSSNVGSYTNGELVIQEVSNASGVIVSDRDEVDLSVTVSNGTFTVGQLVTSQNTGATGFVTFANTTYLKLTGVSQNSSFSSGHVINNDLNSQATVSGVFSVLLLNNVDGPNRFQASQNNIVGQTSGATGICNSYAQIQYPELVRDSGRIVYLDNIQPITRTDTSREDVRLVIKF